jgi:hypothetical protein
MTTSETNHEETPKKKPRRGSKAAIDAEMAATATAARINEMEESYALAIASGETATAARLRARIERLEQGLPEEATEDESAPATPPTSFAADLEAAQADDASVSKEPEWTWEVSEDVIDVPLTDADRANMLRANGADEETKATVDREIDEAKATLKEKKAESETIAARMKDRNRSGSKETAPKKAHWKVGTCFALNTLVYVDPDTGVEVSRRPLTQRERQLELGVDKALDLLKPTEGGQLSLGDVEPTDDINDPAALLAAAQEGETDPADEPLHNEASASDLGEDDSDDDQGDEEEESES